MEKGERNVLRHKHIHYLLATSTKATNRIALVFLLAVGRTCQNSLPGVVTAQKKLEPSLVGDKLTLTLVPANNSEVLSWSMHTFCLVL